MVITDRTRKVPWGSLGNFRAIGMGEVAATSDNDGSIIARTTAASSPHGLKVHVTDAQIGLAAIVGSPNVRLVPGVRRYPFWRE